MRSFQLGDRVVFQGCREKNTITDIESQDADMITGIVCDTQLYSVDFDPQDYYGVNIRAPRAWSVGDSDMLLISRKQKPR